MSAVSHPELPLPEGLDGSWGCAIPLSPACPSGATLAPMHATSSWIFCAFAGDLTDQEKCGIITGLCWFVFVSPPQREQAREDVLNVVPGQGSVGSARSQGWSGSKIISPFKTTE